MKIYDITYDSIELHARSASTLNKHVDDATRQQIPDGYVDVHIRVGGEELVMWFPPEEAAKLGHAALAKATQCLSREYDPS